MNLLVPIMLFCWVPLTIVFFAVFPPRTAIIYSVIGGTLFLPMASYDFPGLPSLSKTTAIALGLLLGIFFSGQKYISVFRWNIYDVPMALWCFASPLTSSIVNGLGTYNGISGVVSTYLTWGVFYWTGRAYFTNQEALRELTIGIIIGGLIYIPLCLFEVRMSPQLSNIFYGFFPHSFAQHLRYGGFRPIVFMQHGLMVALWMSFTATASFWLWRNGTVRYIKNVPISLITIALALTTLLCKSANGFIMLFVGFGSFVIFKMSQSVSIFRLLLLVFPCYVLLSVGGLLESNVVENIVRQLFDEERASSLSIRMLQEDLFLEKAIEQPFFGWGGYDRAWPIDPETGEKLVRMIDSFWLIVFSNRGWFGIVAITIAMLTGPWLSIHSFRSNNFERNYSQMDQLLLSLLVVLFMIDCIVNSMLNPVYIMISGALIGAYTAIPVFNQPQGVHAIHWR